VELQSQRLKPALTCDTLFPGNLSDAFVSEQPLAVDETIQSPAIKGRPLDFLYCTHVEQDLLGFSVLATSFFKHARLESDLRSEYKIFFFS
jgi:hypothetical protein